MKAESFLGSRQEAAPFSVERADALFVKLLYFSAVLLLGQLSLTSSHSHFLWPLMLLHHCWKWQPHSSVVFNYPSVLAVMAPLCFHSHWNKIHLESQGWCISCEQQDPILTPEYLYSTWFSFSALSLLVCDLSLSIYQTFKHCCIPYRFLLAVYLQTCRFFCLLYMQPAFSLLFSSLL